MSSSEIQPYEENSVVHEVNEQRYWRVRGNLQRFMELTGVRIEGREKFEELAEIDEGQGAIIAPTHSSWLDILALGSANTTRPMRFLAKKELWKVPYVGGLARDVGALEVNRSDDKSKSKVLEQTVDLIEKGEWLVMYPEGTRNKTDDRRSLGKLKTGVARVALLSSGVTNVLPIGIGYRRGLFRKKAGLFHVGVSIGEPLPVEQAELSPENISGITENLRSKLLELKSRATDLAES